MILTFIEAATVSENMTNTAIDDYHIYEYAYFTLTTDARYFHLIKYLSDNNSCKFSLKPHCFTSTCSGYNPKDFNVCKVFGMDICYECLERVVKDFSKMDIDPLKQLDETISAETMKAFIERDVQKSKKLKSSTDHLASVASKKDTEQANAELELMFNLINNDDIASSSSSPFQSIF